MAYFRKLSSLEEMATLELAINFAQDNSFKEVAMCLEKPISDFAVRKSRYPNNLKKEVLEWDEAIEKQCQILTEGLPNSLKIGVCVWITRIAMEYSSYIRRMELLFKIPRYFFMNTLSRQDWMKTGHINEKGLAKRLLKDDQLTVLQRYRIACVYCLRESIPHLWNRLKSEEKQLIIGYDDPRCSQEKNSFVLLWSYFMDGRREEKVTQQKNHLWTYATHLAVHYGNKATLLQCWKRLNKHTRKHTVMHRALQSLEKWKLIRDKDRWREELVSNEYRSPRTAIELIENFNLPSYYSELVRFFLSKMSKRQQLTFFDIAFSNWSKNFDSGDPGFSILDCFSEWPLQDDFLPTMKILWGIIPKDIYGQCLLSLAGKYNQTYHRHSSSTLFYKKENLYYDYRTMLWYLWDEAPEEHKQYVFSYKKLEFWNSYRKPVIEYLLPMLVARSPLQKKDVALFKRVWHDVPQETRKAVMYDQDKGNICLELVKKEMWSLMNWLLKECLPEMEIPSFKLKFAESSIIRVICFTKLQNNCEKFVESFIDWAFESDVDKLQFKYQMIKEKGVIHCGNLLSKEEYTEMERIMNFCLSSEEMKLQFKLDVVKETCRRFLKDCAWEQLDRSVSWVFDSEEKINNFKKDFFHSDPFLFNLHHKLIFNPSPQWENVECFYKWFCLSPEEIAKLKTETVFVPRVIYVVHKALCGTMDTVYKKAYGELDTLIRSLRWCLTDEERVITFREEIEKYCYELRGSRHDENLKKGKERLGYLVSELLQSSQKEVVQEKTSRGHFMKNKRRKKSLMIEHKSSSKRKRF